VNANESVPAEHLQAAFGACHGDDKLERFRDCGATWKRGGSGWQDQEPEPGEYDWAKWDRMVTEAAGNDVTLFPVLNYTALWASEAEEGDEEPYHYPMREEHVRDWRDYVARFVDRYDQHEYFEVWNEPNLYKFLRVPEDERHRVYVDRILEPAAEVLHDRGKKVVAPSITTEMWGWNVEENAERIDKWLQYGDALEAVDCLSVHYLKGDTEKHETDTGENLFPFLEHVYEEYVEPGHLDGIWNTEEGFTAVEVPGDGFVALEPWEREPYTQWVPKYTLPFFHWAIDHGWDARDDFKLFWYRMGHTTNTGTLDPCNLLEKGDDGEVRRSPRGRTLRTLLDAFEGVDASVGTFDGDVSVGFGVETDYPYEFPAYPFVFDERELFVPVWYDLPGIDLTREECSTIEAEIDGVDPESVSEVVVQDHVDGSEIPAAEWWATGKRTLRADLHRTSDPVVYLRVRS